MVCLISNLDDITPVLNDLHWVFTQFRLTFKILFLVYKAVNEKASSYISASYLLNLCCHDLR